MAKLSTGTPASAGAAAARRKVVLGATERVAGGPAGAALATASSARKQTPADPPPRSKRKSKPRGERAAGGKVAFHKLTGRASGGIILAEFVAGAVIIFSGIFTKGLGKGYLETMSQILLRLSALSIVFFVLFLVAGSERAGKAAAWFGLLVDLGIVFNAATESQFTTLADIFSGKGTGTDKTVLTASTNVPEPKPVQLPDE